MSLYFHTIGNSRGMINMHPPRRSRRASRRNTRNNSGCNENLDKNFSITDRNIAHPDLVTNSSQNYRSTLKPRNFSTCLSFDFTRHFVTTFTRRSTFCVLLSAYNRENMFSFAVSAQLFARDWTILFLLIEFQFK